MGAFVYAAPVDVPIEGQGLRSQIFKNEDLAITLSVAGEYEYLDKRKLSKNSGELEAQIASGKVILSLLDIDGADIDIYGSFGQARDIEYREKVDGTKFVYELDNKTLWGAGFNVSCDVDLFGSETLLFLDGKYRTIKNVKADTLIVDGTRYKRSHADVDIKSRFKYREWQAALGLGKEFDFFTPYMGVKYSYVRSSGELTVDGDTYFGEKQKARDNVGAFVGFAITPADMFSINLQGRFIDEEAYSASALIRF